MNELVRFLLIFLKVWLFFGIGYMWKTWSIKRKLPENHIGTIVVDHSDDGEANIFLEIANNDVEKWENGKEYSVRVEVRDYITHD